MNIITTKVHACFDYASAIVMICSSYLFQLSVQENYILFISGIITIIYSAFTNYEFALLHLIGTTKHFKLDFLTGLALVLLPVFFSFGFQASLLFFVCGGVKLMISLISDPKRAASKKYMGNFHKQCDMPIYGKMEKFPRIKF